MIRLISGIVQLEIKATSRTSGISDMQAATLVAAVSGFPGCWSVDRHEVPDGTLLLLVTEGGGTAASFAVDGSVAVLALAVLREDVLRPCGNYDSMDELIAALRDLVDAEMVGCHNGRLYRL